MFTKKALVHISVVLLLIIIACTFIYITRQKIPVTTYISENPKITDTFKSQLPPVQKLEDLQIIDNKAVKNIKIIMSTQNINSMYSEADSNGVDYISSKYDADGNGNAIITLYTSDVFFTLPKNRQAELLNNYFWKVADLMIKRNTHSIRDNTDHPDVFSLKS